MVKKEYKQYILSYSDIYGKNHIYYVDSVKEAMNILKTTLLEKGTKSDSISPYVNRKKCFIYEKTENIFWNNFLIDGIETNLLDFFKYHQD